MVGMNMKKGSFVFFERNSSMWFSVMPSLQAQNGLMVKLRNMGGHE
jgi:hypothetical protein|eukprot:COSAG02_NODE_362_length_23815_cov_27.096981_13_plen_46_part_00